VAISAAAAPDGSRSHPPCAGNAPCQQRSPSPVHIKLNPCQASRTSPERPITKSQRAKGRLGHGGFGQVNDETSRTGRARRNQPM
jgi:hypothetical protein